MSFMRQLRVLDAFPKIQDDFYSKTLSGGVITIACSAVMACLFVSELGAPCAVLACCGGRHSTMLECQKDVRGHRRSAIRVDSIFKALSGGEAARDRHRNVPNGAQRRALSACSLISVDPNPAQARGGHVARREDHGTCASRRGH